MARSRVILRCVLVLTLLLTGCGEGDSYAQVDLTLSSDPELLRAATGVRLQVFQGRAGVVIRDNSALFSDGLVLPQVATLIPVDNDPSRQFSVLAELLSGSQILATQRMQGTFVAGRKVTVSLRFTNGCGGSCGANETCIEAACRSACYEASGGQLVSRPCGGVDGGLDASDGSVPEAGPSDGGVDASEDVAIDVPPARCGMQGTSDPWHACFEEVVMGANFTCASATIRDEPEIGCWGASDAGALGGGETRYRFADGSPGYNGNGLTAGHDVTCYIGVDGRTHCMGNLPSNVSPPPTAIRETPVEIANAPLPEAISARDGLLCGIQDNELNCLGPAAHAVSRHNLVAWESVKVGANHICGVADGGTRLLCWGDNNYGQLFLSGDATAPRSVPLDGMLPTRGSAELRGQVVDLSLSDSHTCVIMLHDAVRTLFCTGRNIEGQLGSGLGGAGGIVPVGSNFTQVSAGNGYTCAVTTAGGIDCWGRNDFGQLGNELVEPTNYDRQHVPLPDDSHGGAWARVFAGTTHTCALTIDNTLYCWGDNSGRQLSNGQDEDGPFLLPQVVLRQWEPD